MDASTGRRHSAELRYIIAKAQEWGGQEIAKNATWREIGRTAGWDCPVACH